MIVMTASEMRVYDLTLQEYPNSGAKAYTFSASSLRPNKHGIYSKFYMRVQPDLVPRLERLKIKNGSIVDIVAAPDDYKKNDKYYKEWEVRDISISNIPSSTRNRDTETDSAKAGSDSSNISEMQKQDETLASILLGFSTNMFSQ